MSIQFQSIPNILINDSNIAFNGYIYSADYNIAYGNEGTSSVIINIISESGTYAISTINLRLDQIYTIKIGSNITLPMYLKRYKIIQATSGKILEVEFIDGSFELDRKYIGLYKRMGMSTGTDSDSILTKGTQFNAALSCLIIVGKEHHPCDRDYDGNFDDVADLEDPCHPCNRDSYEISQAQLTLVNCIETVKYNILPVQYNFTELVDALTSNGFVLVNAIDPNTLYHANYEGTVRDVLSNWCADFGWIFYWENNQIIFRDLRTVINVNATISQFCPNLSATEDEATLDGTVSTAMVTNYTREGRGKQRYTCQDAIHIQINPYNQSNAAGGQLAITSTINETAAAWSLYSPKLRTLYYWFGEYDLDDRELITPGLILPELGMKILSDPIFVQADTSQSTGFGDGFSVIGLNDIAVQKDESGAIIPFLEADSLSGELQVVQDAIDGSAEFTACFKLLTEEDQWRLAANMNGKYFFVAQYNQHLENKFGFDESSYAGSFWGKYYVFIPDGEFWENTIFIADNPGCTGNSFSKDGNVNWQAIDINNASFSFLNNQAPGDPPVPLSSLPFANFLAAFKDAGYAPPDEINFKLAMVSKGGEEWDPSPGAVDPDENILLDNDKDNVRNSKLIDQAWEFAPKEVQSFNAGDGSNVITDTLEIGLEDLTDKDKSQIKIFLGSSMTGITTTISGAANDKTTASKPFNGKPLNPNETTDPDLQELVIYEYPFLQCLPIGNVGNSCDQYMMTIPSMSIDFWFNAPTNTPYAVVIEKTKMRNQKLRKVETVMHSGSCPNNSTLKFDVNFQPINDQTINDIRRIPDTSLCTYDLDTIEQVHSNFAANLPINQVTPLIRKTFTVEGIDIAGPIPTIDDGLLGMKISVGTDGVRTTYEFGTTKMIAPSKSEVYQLALGKQLANVGTLSETFGPGILQPNDGNLG
jgi:hypothetical protein